MDAVYSISKVFAIAFGSVCGWVIAEFQPTFPLIIVTVVLIMYDAWTAFQLDKRVKVKYPDRKKRPAKFTSFAFGKVISNTIPKRLILIILAFLVEHWIFIHVEIPLSYIVTGAIAFEQFWSIFENESSCRDEESSRFWKVLQKIMVDKTARHFDVEIDNDMLHEKEKEDGTNQERQQGRSR